MYCMTGFQPYKNFVRLEFSHVKACMAGFQPYKNFIRLDFSGSDVFAVGRRPVRLCANLSYSSVGRRPVRLCANLIYSSVGRRPVRLCANRIYRTHVSMYIDTTLGAPVWFGAGGIRISELVEVSQRNEAATIG